MSEDYHNIMPRWMQDGKGLRGDPNIVHSASIPDARPARIEAGSSADEQMEAPISEAGGGGGGGIDADGQQGQMLFHDGTEWVVLSNPGSGTDDAVLRHDGTKPYWETPEPCQ